MIVEPKSKKEFQLYYNLRWEVLRKPWGKPKGSERSESDSVGFHRMILDKSDKPIAVGMLLHNGGKVGQIRFMAVSQEYRGMNAGSKLMFCLESLAIEHKIETIILHAREVALGFYIKKGYKNIEKSYLLFNEIQHYLMSKNL